jgi:hypothetical protein
MKRKHVSDILVDFLCVFVQVDFQYNRRLLLKETFNPLRRSWIIQFSKEKMEMERLSNRTAKASRSKNVTGSTEKKTEKGNRKIIRYKKGDSVHIASDFPEMNKKDVSHNDLYFWDQLALNQQKEVFCLMCGSDLYQQNRCHQRYCSESCFNQALTEKGLWFYFEFEVLHSEKLPETGVNGTRLKLWKNFKKYLQRIPSLDDQQVLISSVKLLSVFLCRSLQSLQSISLFPATTSDLIEFFKTQFLNFFELFPVPLDNATNEYDETITETFSLLQVIIQYGEYENDILPTLFSFPSSDCGRVLSAFLHQDVFNVHRWYDFNWIVHQYAQHSYQPSQFLRKVTQLSNSAHNTLEEQKKILSEYEPFLQETMDYFIQGQEVLTSSSPVTLKSSPAEDNNIRETQLQQERIISRLSQAAELANKPNLFGNSLSSNPFDGFGFMILFLSPQYLPKELISSKTESMERGLFSQSCIPNIIVDIHQAQQSSSSSSANGIHLQLQFIANRNIYWDEPLTINILKETTPMTVSKLTGERTFSFKSNLEFLRIHNSKMEDNEEEDEEKNEALTVMSVTCSCHYCKYSVDSRFFLLERVSDPVVTGLLRSKLSSGSESQEISLLLELIPLFQERLYALQSVEQMTSTLLSVAGNKFQSLHELHALANEFMVKDKIYLGMIFYLIIFLEIMESSSLEGQCKEEEEKDISDWLAELCLSTGMTIFEYLIKIYSVNSSSLPRLGKKKRKKSTAVDLSSLPWKVNDILQIFDLGKSIASLLKSGEPSANFTLLTELSKKLEDYRLLWDETSPRHSSLMSSYSSQMILSSQLYRSSQLLTAEECKFIIGEAESFSQRSERGWSTSRHYSVPTTDIPVSSIPSLSDWFVKDVFQQRIKPLLQQQFYPQFVSSEDQEHKGIGDDIQIIVNDLFVVKYHIQSSFSGEESTANGANQRYLPIHSDQSTHSFVLALNDCEKDFEGGGTYFLNLFEKSNSSLNVMNPSKEERNCFNFYGSYQSIFVFFSRLEQGEMVSFAGSLYHGGDPILSGTRYIIAAFMIIIPKGSVAGDGEVMSDNDEQEESVEQQKKKTNDVFSWGKSLPSQKNESESNNQGASSFQFGFNFE